MHGIKRTENTPQRRAEKLAKDAPRIKDWQDNWQRLISLRKDGGREALNICSHLLRINPECYTVWNIRREILKRMMKEMNDEERQALCVQDLKFGQECIQANPKSYWVWNQRHWLLENMPKPVWDAELALVEKMLDLDKRNFHGWSYRRWLVETGGNSTREKEFDYTSKKIKQNFSNYSAWHYRSKLLGAMDEEERSGKLDKDFELVRSAIFTEPADQSAWFYQQWLLGAKENSKDVLETEIGYIRELLELEPDAKWPLLALVFLLKAKGDFSEIPSLLSKLERVDPMRKNYYREFLEGK